MSLDFFPCKIPIPYNASYVNDAYNVYSKSIVATTHGIVLVKSTPCLSFFFLQFFLSSFFPLLYLFWLDIQSVIDVTILKVFWATSKPNRWFTGGSIRFQPVYFVLNNDNHQETDGTTGQLAVEF